MTRTPRSAAVVLTLAAVAVAITTRMVPYEYRPFNFTAVGAVALFAGGRLGFGAAALAVFAAMGASDVYLYFTKEYSPAWAVYLFYLGYVALGRWQLRRTENPGRIGGVSLAASLLFFLVTNFLSWRGQSLPYSQGLDGLLQSYVMGLPFLAGALLGDVVFTSLLYAAHAVLARTAMGRERAAVRVEDGR